MARWKINGLALDNVRLTAVKPVLAWASYNIPVYLENTIVGSPSRTPQPITLNMSIVGSGRYAMESSIRAELEDTRIFRIKAVRPKDYLYDTKIYGWITPTKFDVEDSSEVLTANIGGFINEKMLYSGGFITDVSGGGGTLTTSYDAQFASRVLGVVMPAGSSIRAVVYTIPAAIDISEARVIDYCIRATYGFTSYDAFEFRIYSGASYFIYNTTSFDANEWSHQEFYLSDFVSTSGSPSLSSVTAIGIASRMTAGLTYNLYIGPIYKE